MMLFFLFSVALLIVSESIHEKNIFTTRNSSCQLKHSTHNHKLLDVYWINLESSTERRQIMQHHLQYYGFSTNYRTKAITPNQIVIPSQLSRPQGCKSLNANETKEELSKIRKEMFSKQHQIVNRTILMTSLCGRPKNTIKELAVTLSHLSSIHRAITSHKHHQHYSSEYVLVFEDDLQFAVEINFQDLIQNYLPSDFVILQLVTSNFYIIDSLWKAYIQDKKVILPRRERDDYWCAGAYLIHKKRFLKLFSTKIFYKKSEKIYISNLIAGYAKPNCVPAECCSYNNDTGKTEFLSNYERNDTACIRSARGYQADNYIFALAEQNTYILTVPVVVNTRAGNTSTLHQDHVSVHHLAFNRTKQIIKDMLIEKKYPIPSFMNPHCVLNFSSEVLI
jgi:GR25 family glycosyltransferase involved in LPS biosynthesis